MDTQPPQPAAADDLLFGPYCLDGRQGLLLRDGADIPLTPKLVDTLRALAEAGGHLVPKETLITRVWPDTAVMAAMEAILGFGRVEVLRWGL
jgi:DNA-binding winged helix-turn-helix (wHTH) protein